METCETCKHYEKCSKNIYDANIERKYLIFYCNIDCWEELWIKDNVRKINKNKNYSYPLLLHLIEKLERMIDIAAGAF